MDANAGVFDLSQAGGADRAWVGGKAGVLGELLGGRVPVPPGLVVTAAAVDIDGWETSLGETARSLGQTVRGAFVGRREDLPDASYAGLYETYLNVAVEGLGEAVRRCFAAATAERVTAYHQRHGAARPRWRCWCRRWSTRWRPEWRSPPIPSPATATRSWSPPCPVWVTRWCPVKRSAKSGASPMAPSRYPTDAPGGRVDGRAGAGGGGPGRPGGRPLRTAAGHRMGDRPRRQTVAVAGPADDSEYRNRCRGRPGAGLWMRNFRLGEWLPEAVTPLFGTWLLPALEDGYLDGMHDSVGVRVPFRYALVNGWYYNATPIPSPKLLPRVLWQGRGRAVKILYNALIRVSRDPAAADRAVLSDLDRQWREIHLPAYRRLVADAQIEAATATPDQLAQLVDQLGREAGIYLWYLAIVGGSAWKMEACLTGSAASTWPTS